MATRPGTNLPDTLYGTIDADLTEGLQSDDILKPKTADSGTNRGRRITYDGDEGDDSRVGVAFSMTQIADDFRFVGNGGVEQIIGVRRRSGKLILDAATLCLTGPGHLTITGQSVLTFGAHSVLLADPDIALPLTRDLVFV